MLNDIITYLCEVHTSRTTREKICFAVTMFVMFSLALSGTIAKIFGMGINTVYQLVDKLFLMLN